MLVLKLLATPALIGLLSVAGRRWGGAVSGWLVALPLTVAPLVFFVALEQGRSFAGTAALGALGGAGAETGFALGYLRVARRGPRAAVAAGTAGFAAAAAVFRALALPLVPAVAAALASLLAGLAVVVRTRWAPVEPVAAQWWEIPARMAAGTGVVVALTALAPALGPRLAGLLATYPLLTAILTVSAQRLEGPAAAAEVLRGLLLGLFSFVAFVAALAALLPRVGLAAFAVAVPAAVALQALTLRFARTRYTRHTPGTPPPSPMRRA